MLLYFDVDAANTVGGLLGHLVEERKRYPGIEIDDIVSSLFCVSVHTKPSAGREERGTEREEKENCREAGGGGGETQVGCSHPTQCPLCPH